MSLYNMLNGANSHRDLIFTLSDLRQGDFDRFRDVWLDADRKLTCVYTRLGGGNRECYCDGDDHYCYVNSIGDLQAHPRYSYDEDDDFDCTYATFYFRWPEANVDALNVIATMQGPPVSGDERWAAVFKALGV